MDFLFYLLDYSLKTTIMKTLFIFSFRLATPLVILLTSFKSYSQSTEYRYKVRIQQKHLVLQDIEDKKGEELKFSSKTVLTYQSKHIIGDTSLTADLKRTVKDDSTVYIPKKIPQVRTLAGNAFITIDSADKSKLNINYWLNPTNTFSIGTKLKFEKYGVSREEILKTTTSFEVSKVSLNSYNAFQKNKIRLKYFEDSLKNRTSDMKALYPLSKPIKKQLLSLEKDIASLKGEIKQYLWLDYSHERIFEMDGNDTVNVYAQKYQSGYYIKLENRQYTSFRFDCIEAGPLTIPFKYRPKSTRKGIGISDELTAEYNIGAYVGYSFGKIRYMYREHEDKKPQKYLMTVGPFLNVSRIEIDSSSTISAVEPLKQKRAIAALSPGIALMTSIYDFRVGFFIGNDITFGSTARKWDYRNKLWIGFGVGYNIGLLWGGSKEVKE